MSDNAWTRRAATGALLSLFSLGGGAALAAVPAAALSISTHLYSASERGIVSVAITASTFISQVAAAAVVESRLSSAGTLRRVAFPVWLATLSLVAAVVLALFSDSVFVLCITLPILVSALEVGRSVSVAERLDAREIWAALLVGLGALGGVVISLLGSDLGFVLLAGGIAGATLSRIIGAHRDSSAPHAAMVGWVVTDVAVTGMIYPALNAVVLVFLGPIQSVLFASISTVSGLLAIPLNFMRVRLLKAHSTFDIWLSGLTLAAGVAVIAVLEFTGVLGLLFGSAWSVAATVVALTIACLWRGASLATTLPFASLRRSGHARLLTLLRGACALVTFVAGILAVTFHDISIIFVVMLGGELLQALVYEAARRRVRAREALAVDDPEEL